MACKQKSQVNLEGGWDGRKEGDVNERLNVRSHRVVSTSKVGMV